MTGDLQRVMDWLREPDCAEYFGPIQQHLWASARPIGAALRLERDLATKDPEIERLTKERDEWKEAANRHHPNPADYRYWEGRYRDEKERATTAEAHAKKLAEALDEAEACMSIVEPRSDKAEYLRILGVIRTTLADYRADMGGGQ